MDALALLKTELARAKAVAAAQEQLREKAERLSGSFREFVPAAWSTVDPSKAYIPNCWHIEAICDHMQAVALGQIKNILIIVPPGSAKSTIVSVMFPAWMWTRDPGWRSTFASYEAGLSTNFSVKCRDLILSDWYKNTFRPKWKLAGDQNEKTYYVNTEKGFRVATSVGGRGTGWRSHFLGIDDCLSTDARFSPPELDFCVKWWKNVWYNRLIDMSTGSRVVIGQRVADNDLIGHLEREGGFETLLIPMEYDSNRSRVTSIGWKDPRTTDGELMFEPLFTREVCDALKKNEDVWATQYQGAPTVEGGGILKSYQWRYWQTRGMGLPPVRVRNKDGRVEEHVAVELPDSFDMVLQSWDCAFKDLKSSDFVVGQKIGVRGANRYVLEQIRDRMDLPATIAAVRRMSGTLPVSTVKLIEDKANGPAVIQMLHDEIPGLLEVQPKGGKVARAAAVTPELAAGNWILPHPMLAPWVGNPENPTEGGFLAETLAFPFGANDDQVDALSQACVHIQKERIGGVFGVSEQDIRVEPMDLKLIETWPKLYGLSVSWQEVGAVWMARQPETGQHYLWAEYVAQSGDPARHVEEIRKIANVLGVMTAKDTGRELKDGYALASKYRALGLNLDTMQECNESAVLDLAEALRSGKLKVFGTLGRFFDEFRLYRRDDSGRLPSYNVAAIKAAMVVWRSRELAKAPMDPAKRPQQTAPRGQHGWMAG